MNASPTEMMQEQFAYNASVINIEPFRSRYEHTDVSLFRELSSGQEKVCM